MILVLLAVLAVAFWLTGVSFKVLGKIIGFVVSVLGYGLLAVLFFGIIGAAIFGLPILLVVAAVSIIIAVVRK